MSVLFLWGFVHVAWAGPLEQALAERPGVVAVVVEQKGEVVTHRQLREGSHRHRQPGADPTLHDVRSVGKSITALAVLAAVADGHLSSTEVRLGEVLPDAAEGPHAGTRLLDLLTMSSTLDCDDWQGRRSPGFEERMYRRRSWRSFVLRLPVRRVALDERGLAPFSYCTAGVFLLGQVVEEAVGEPFDAYVQRRLLDPIGIEAVQWTRSRSAEVQAGGQLELRATDLAKLGRLALDGGRWQGQQLVPEALVSEMLQPWRTLGPGTRYGQLWWGLTIGSPAGPEEVWAMTGNGGNLVLLSRRADAVVVVQADDYGQGDAVQRSVDLAAAALAGLPDVP